MQAHDLSEVQRWVYWLSNVNPVTIAASDSDLAVIDYSVDGTDATAFDREDVVRMKRRADGKQRILLGYLSVGEAEEYRYYWKSEWMKKASLFRKSKRPAWLDKENPDWEGNYKVHYWDPEWQAIIFGSPDAYLDKIIAQGFDGVYLDIIDGFEYYEKERPAAVEEMANFVSELAAYARSKAGEDFLIFGQNGLRLLAVDTYLNALNGVGKEDLFFREPSKAERAAGITASVLPSDESEINFSMPFLAMAQEAGKLVLNIEYPAGDPKLAMIAVERSRKAGFLPLIAHRELETINPPQPVWIKPKQLATLSFI